MAEAEEPLRPTLVEEPEGEEEQYIPSSLDNEEVENDRTELLEKQKTPETNLSLADFGAGLVYPSLHNDVIASQQVVSKTYEEKRLEQDHFNRATGNVQLTVTPELEEFNNTLGQLTALSENFNTRADKNWVSRAFKWLRVKAGDVGPKRRVIKVKTPQHIEQYFREQYREETTSNFNPEFIGAASDSPITIAFRHYLPAEQLCAIGLRNLTSLQLATIGLTIPEFRHKGRNPNELATFFDTLDRLESAGFVASSFDSRSWSLHGISRAYNADPIDVANKFAMTCRNLLNAGVPPIQLRAFGVTAENVIHDRAPFELFLAMKMTLQEQANTFGLRPEHLFSPTGRPIMSVQQMQTLSVIYKWNLDNLRACGFSELQIECLFSGDELKYRPLTGIAYRSKLRKDIV